ncbi:serine proteinase stubble [Nephila pilipes]|uniref:Serine proteinase stubble n=1 Tax=Nephila pilipes TaxID=299642 RepID=A0A8X6NB72_NEPPI|nr:serine proteinase stubble [Nephila pilipes]
MVVSVLVADAYAEDGEISVKSATVAVATQSKNSQFVTFRIHSVKLHPRFEVRSEQPVYDIALLKLKDTIMFSERIRPICLTKKYFLESPGMAATVIGWGEMEEGGNSTRRLKEAVVPIRSPAECKRILRQQPYALGSYSICAGGYPLEDSCEGDSGGPLQVKDECGRWNLIGLVSWGLGCGKSIPAVYTRVAKFVKWILTNTADSMSCNAVNFPRLEPNIKECGLSAYRYMKTGIPVRMVELPFMANIYYGPKFIGTGVLVNSTILMTTTGVIHPWGKSLKFSKLRVHFGFPDNNKNSSDYLYESVEVKQIIFHAFAYHRFNLCLLQLGVAMTDSLMKFHPVCFSHFKTPYVEGDDVTIAAYIGGYLHSYKFAKARMRMLSVCREVKTEWFPENRTLCANQISKNYIPIPTNSRKDRSCAEEKGALIMNRIEDRYYLIGLSSRPRSCSSPRIFYDVNWAVPWITTISSLLDVV